MSKAEAIRAIIKENPGMSVKDVAAKVGVRPQYVHGIIYLMRNRKATRPYKKKDAVYTEHTQDNKNAVYTAPKAAKKDVGVAKSEKPDLQAKLDEAHAVIRYLERRLYGASV